MLKIYSLLLIICSAFAIFPSRAAAQNDSEATPAPTSQLNNISLPAGAQHVNQTSVPAEINETLGKLVALGQGKVRQGASELLIWNGGYKKSNKSQFTRKFVESLRSSGWNYEVGEENAEFTVFNSINQSERRAAIGFWTAKDDFLMLAWTEMLPVNLPNADSLRNSSGNSNNQNFTNRNDGAVKIVNAEKNALWVNVAGEEMPPMPQFPALAPKPGRVRGYVKDSSGKPIVGASIGVRGSYFAGQYSGAQGTTDAKGYYEFVVPKGSAHFYNAGFQIEWGKGLAAVSLHPADGKLDSFTTADGAVENFVLLHFGITSRENLQKNPRVASTYYGGSIYVHYYAAEANDNRPMAGSLVENSILEITLTSEDAGGKNFVIRQPIGFAGNLTLNNIPLGRYKISAKNGGKTLKIAQNGKANALFGLTPSATTGETRILFPPSGADASMIGPANGAWNSVEINLTMP